MPIKNVLIKISGNLTKSKKALDFIKKKSRKNYVIVVCGGGSRINQALEKAGHKVRFNKHGRITETWQERKIARDILEQEEKNLQDKLIGSGAIIQAPVLYAGSVVCHINGDNLVKAFYLGFDEIFVLTKEKRIKDKKKKIFEEYPKIKIKGF